VACLPVPRAFSSFLLFAWWPPLFFLVRNYFLSTKYCGRSKNALYSWYTYQKSGTCTTHSPEALFPRSTLLFEWKE
jgi:hypothetical protein